MKKYRMRPFGWVGLLITLVCIWDVCFGYDFFLAPNSGERGFGRFPVSEHDELRSFLTNHDFAQYFSLEANRTQTLEKFRGSYKNSQPFCVTVLTEDANALGITVDVSWSYRGHWHHSSDKAADFAEILYNRLETERLGGLPR